VHIYTRVAIFSLSQSGTGVWSGATSEGITPRKLLEFCSDLVYFCAVWWQLFVETRYIYNFAIKIEPSYQIQCPHDCTAVLSLLSNEHALKFGTFSVLGMVLPGRGTTWHKSGTGQP